MRNRTITIAAGILLLAACGTTETTAEQSPAPAGETTNAQEPVIVETTEAPTAVDPSGPPQECIERPTAGDPFASVEDADLYLAEAVLAVPMPETLAEPGVQIVKADSDLDPALRDMIVRLCGEEITEEQQRSLASEIAIAVSRADGDGVVNRFIVELWVPDGSGSLTESRNLYVDDFGLFLWEPGGARPIETIWETGD